MQPLKVTSIQRGCVYDGRGVRTTVFLKGCSLHCPWCCNPETISADNEIFIDESKCLKNQGTQGRFCRSCERCGGEMPITACPLGVGENTAKYHTSEELYEILIKDIGLYTQTGGGVTFSGGEPLIQAEGLLPLLQKLKQEKIDVVFETTLVAPTDALNRVLPYADGFIVDFKLQPQMKLYDKAYIRRIKAHYALLNGKRNTNRIVFVDELAAHREKVVSVLRKLGIERIELLLCHDLGAKKYEKLGLAHTDCSADIESMKNMGEYLSDTKINMTILSI